LSLSDGKIPDFPLPIALCHVMKSMGRDNQAWIYGSNFPFPNWDSRTRREAQNCLPAKLLWFPLCLWLQDQKESNLHINGTYKQDSVGGLPKKVKYLSFPYIFPPNHGREKSVNMHYIIHKRQLYGLHIWFTGKILVKDVKAFLLNLKLLNADINEMAFTISCLFSCLPFNMAPFVSM